MHFSPTCCQKCERQCSKNDLLPAQFDIPLQKKLQYSLFDQPESRFVQAKKYLAGHHGRGPAVRYFQPCMNPPVPVTILKLRVQGCQGHALAEPGGPRRPTFAPGRLENLRFFIQIICWVPWILQVQSLGRPPVFLKAQPWLHVVYMTHYTVCHKN